MDVVYDTREQAAAIRGVPQEVCDAFSNRHREVARRAKEIAHTLGLPWDEISADRKSGLMQTAAVRDRLAKNDGMTDRETWTATATRLGWRHRSVLGQAEPSLSPGALLDAAYRHAARHVAEAFRTTAVLTNDVLRTHAARALIGAGLDGPEDIDRVVEALTERGIMLNGAPARLVFGRQGAEVAVTNTAQVTIERGVMELAAQAAADRSGALLPGEIADAVAATGLDRSSEPEHALAQRAAIHALGAGGRLGVVIGVAGAGKTTLMAPLVRAWQARGRDVIGLGLAWRQADALRDTGTQTHFAVQPFLDAVTKGEVRVRRGTVLAIDWPLSFRDSLLKLQSLMTGRPMASISIRNLDESLKSRLRVQAAFHGRSMEDEARDILRSALNREPSRPGNLAASIRARFSRLGGVELPVVPREPMREPPAFEP